MDTTSGRWFVLRVQKRFPIADKPHRAKRGALIAQPAASAHIDQPAHALEYLTFTDGYGLIRVDLQVCGIILEMSPCPEIHEAEHDKSRQDRAGQHQLAQAQEENHRVSGELVEAVARVAELTVALRSARSVPVDTASIAGALTVLVNGRIKLKDVSADTNPIDLIELAKNLTDIAVELQRARKVKAEK